MSCNTFLDQCCCEGSLINLVAPASGNYTMEIYSRFTNRKQYFDVVVVSGDNFVLPVELNGDSIYELVIKQGNTIIEIADAVMWYLNAIVCVDGQTGTITVPATSFEYALENQSADIDLNGVVIDTSAGAIEVTAGLFDDYRCVVYRTGLRQVETIEYNRTGTVFSFTMQLAGEQIIFEFIKI